MTWFIKAVFHDLRCVAVAAYDLLVGRRRRQYCHETVIKAPKEVVKRLLTAPDVTYERGNVRIVTEPLAGVDGVEVARVSIAGQPYANVALQRSEPTPDTLVCRYLPEYSERTSHIGEDDINETHIEALADGSTRLCWRRTLTHRRPGTRISAPMGMRNTAWLIRTQAEKEAGLVPAPRSQVPQLAWLIVAIASFGWLLGWLDAAILVLVIIAHELGHAAAMVATGRGVRYITLVPFFGGMAAPKLHYENEWQRAVVALMGPSLSLLPTLVLLWLAFALDSPLAARAAFLSAIVNGTNLLPLVPLDGGIVVTSVLRALHVRLSHAIAWIGVAAGLALALWAQSILIGVIFAFGALQLVFQSSLDTDAHLKRLTGFQAPALIAVLALTAFAYVTIIAHSTEYPGLVAELGGPQAVAAEKADRE